MNLTDDIEYFNTWMVHNTEALSNIREAWDRLKAAVQSPPTDEKLQMIVVRLDSLQISSDRNLEMLVKIYEAIKKTTPPEISPSVLKKEPMMKACSKANICKINLSYGCLHASEHRAISNCPTVISSCPVCVLVDQPSDVKKAEKESNPWQPATGKACSKCYSIHIQYRITQGDHEDCCYRCNDCGHTWWADGIDS